MKTSSRKLPRSQSPMGARLLLLPGLMLLLIFSLVLIPVALAQSPITELAALELEFWPDYDRPAVLVLITGTLADDQPVPATVLLPLPEEADINAVAHVDVESGELQIVADTDTSTPGEITLTTPSPTFRIEYYMPYTVDGDRHEFDFDWSSGMTIDQVITTVQQPAGASDFELSPASDEPTTGRDGLTYHPLAAQALPAGQSFSLTAGYNLEDGQLSADVLAAQQPSVQGPLPVVSDPAQEGSSDINWPLVAIVAGGLIVVAALAWFLYTNNQSGRKRPAKPRPTRETAPASPKSPASSSAAAVSYCHKCGRPVDPEDRFCRECGTAVKGR